MISRELVKSSIRNAGPALTAAAVTAVLALTVLLRDPQAMLAPICAELMYARGWFCFFIWLPTAILATPVRAAEPDSTRPIIHGAAWTVAWLWWLIAVTLAGLFARADLLFIAYLLTGGSIILWRTLLHRVLLAWFARHALHRASYAPGLIAFAGAQPSDASASHTSFHDAVLGRIGRLRNHSWVARWHQRVFGSRGASAILLAETMRSTDLRCLALRSALAQLDESGLSARTQDDAHALGRAFLCETEVWLTMRRVSDEQPIGAAIQARALCVYALLSLAMARGVLRRSADMQSALKLLANNESFPVRALQMIESAENADIRHFDQLIVDGEQLTSLGTAPRTLGRLSYAVALCRLQLFKQARGVLANAHRELAIETGEDVQPDLLVRAQQTLDALRGEVERASTAIAGPETAERPRSADDRKVLEERARKGHAAMQSGLHPAVGRSVIPSEFGRLPRPLRPREVGVGLIAGAIAIACWMVISLGPLVRPLPDRLQTVTEVPFGGKIASDGVRSAAVATPREAPTILLAKPEEPGVTALDLRTLRTADEGGEGTALNGTVQKLAASPDASMSDISALAVFLADEGEGVDRSLCLSSRDRSGNWTSRIPPAELHVRGVGGEDLEAALSGLSEPLFLRRSGSDRLLRYSEQTRSLRKADVKGLQQIEGRFVDFAESGASQSPRRIVLLTTVDGAKGGRVYSITESSKETPIEVTSIALPPLEVRAAVGVCIGTGGRVFMLDSEGGVWRTKSAGATTAADWERLRPGGQGLKLDRIDLALVTKDGKRLWFIREKRAWTRLLEPSVNDADVSEGWSMVDLPRRTSDADAANGRWQLMEVPGDTASIYLLAPTHSVNPTGTGEGSLLKLSAQRATRVVDGSSAESIQMAELLSEDETLFDADTTDGLGALAIIQPPRQNATNPSFRLEILQSGRRLLRNTPLTSEAFSMDQLLAVGTFEGKTVAIDLDGRFIRFDSARDALLGDDDPQPPAKHVRQIDLPPNLQPRAAVITARQGAEFMQVLEKTGSVREFEIKDRGASTGLLVDATPRAPTELLTPRAFFTDANGATLFTDTAAWRFNALQAAGPFTDWDGQLGNDPEGFVVTKIAQGHTLAWLSDGGKLLWSLSNGVPAPAQLRRGLSRLRPELGGALFALTRDGGNNADQLVRVELDGTISELLQPQRGGPAEPIKSSAIRDGFVDFVTESRLHSISRTDATWTSSKLLNGKYEIESVEDGGAVLVPTERGMVYYVAPESPADGEIELAPGKPLANARVLGEGVIGVTESGPEWLSFDRKSRTGLPSRSDPKINLDQVSQVLTSGDDLILVGSKSDTALNAKGAEGGASDRIVRYSMRSSAWMWPPVPLGAQDSISSVELVGNSLYVLTRQSLSRLRAGDLALDFAYTGLNPSILEKSVLGECDAAPAVDPALLTADSIFTLNAKEASERMKAAVPKPGGAPQVEWATTWRGLPGNDPLVDQIALFTSEGAWRRSASPRDPFRKIDHIPNKVDFVTLSPAGQPWVRASQNWISLLPNALASGAGIGWTKAGDLISDEGGQPKVNQRTMRAFQPAGRGIGRLTGLERLQGIGVLLIGETGTLMFDPETREFPRMPEAMGEWVPKALYDTPAGLIATRADGRAAILSPLWRQDPFGPHELVEVLPTPGPLARARDGRIWDSSGRAVENVPPGDPGPEIKTIGAVAIGSTIYRLGKDGGIDSVDISSFARARRRWVADESKISAIAKAGDQLLAYDSSANELFEPERPANRWRVKDKKWFVGRNSVAFVVDDPNNRSSISLLPRGFQLPQPAAESLPGSPLGNLARSTVAVIPTTGGTILFDLFNGTKVSKRVYGGQCFIDDDKLWSIESGVVTCIDTLGREVVRQEYDSAGATRTRDGLRAFGLRKAGGDFELLEVDTQNAAPVVRRRWAAEYSALVRELGDRLSSVRLSDESTLVISSAQLALIDGDAVTLQPNPLARMELELYSYCGQVFVENAGGSRVRLIDQDADGYRFSPRSAAATRIEMPWTQELYRLAKQRLDVPPPSAKVRLHRGTLDAGSGWLLEERPTHVSHSELGIQVHFEMGAPELIPGTPPERSDRALVEPLKYENDSIYAKKGERWIELGRPIAGELLKAHQIRAVAPIEDGIGPAVRATGIAWIDEARQLWIRRGGQVECVDSENKFDRFLIDGLGQLHAVGDETLLSLQPLKLIPWKARPVELLEDCRQLGGQCGWIRWNRDRDGETLAWEAVAQGNASVELQPREAGFNLIAGAALGSSQAGACLVLRDEPPLSVPITVNDGIWSVNWTAPPSTQKVAKPAQSRQPGKVIDQRGQVLLRIDERGAAFFIGDVRFDFNPEKRCFDCNICSAASSLDGDVVTRLANGKIARWTLNGDQLTDPRFLPDVPPAARGIMWSSPEGLLCVEDTGSIVAERHWCFRGGQWQLDRVASKFLTSPNAATKWVWNGTDQLTYDGIDYMLDSAQWPRLDFERLSLQSRPRTLAKGEILYQVYEGDQAKWYKLECDACGLPRPANRPQRRQRDFRVGPISILAGDDGRPICKFDSEWIELKVVNGLIPDLDQWRADAGAPIHPCDDENMACVPVGRQGANIFREVRLVGKVRLELLPPVRRTDVIKPIRRKDRDGSLSLDLSHSLKANDVLLGVPRADGFPLLDTTRIVPISHARGGQLRFCRDGGMYGVSTDAAARAIDSIRELGKAPSVLRAEWVQYGRAPEFVAIQAADRPGMFVVPNGLVQAASKVDEGRPIRLHGTDHEAGTAFGLTAENAAIRLSKEGYEIVLSKDGSGKIVPEHTRATRILASEDGFTTYSDEWVAAYAMTGGRCVLQAVRSAEKRDKEGVEPSVALGGGLFAHRSGTAWKIGITAQPDGPVYRFDLLKAGPRRIYSAGEEGILEVTEGWQRLTASDGSLAGSVRERAISSKPHALAGSTARRHGRFVLADEGAYVTTTTEPSIVNDEPPAPGQLDHRGETWGFSLQRAGAELAISYRGYQLPLKDGALPLDFAVGIGMGRSAPWMIDRLSSVSLADGEASRAIHATPVLNQLAANQPARLASWIHDERPIRAIQVVQNDVTLGLMLPRDGMGALEANMSSPRIESWSIGSTLDVRFDREEQVEFRRWNRSNRAWVPYPPLARKDACVAGRFAFDTPVDVVYGRHPERRTVEACVVMKAGWEWLESSSDGLVFVTTHPQIEEPEYGAFIRPKWLEHSDLDERTATPDPAVSGAPIIWYPHEDRLFLIGERNVMWVELGARWHGRTVSAP